MQNIQMPGTSPVQITYSTFTSLDRARVLSKTIGPDGRASASATMSDGTVKVCSVPDLLAFAKHRASLSCSEALGYGVPKCGSIEARVTTQEKLASQPGAIARTRDHFQWPTSDRILMLDYDPVATEAPMEPDALLRTLKAVCPTLDGVEMLWTPSASSFIYRGEDQVVGLAGQRVYVRLAAGADPVAAGQHIEKCLWARGWGRVVPSKAGVALFRCPVDTNVWQPERLDYAGRPLTMPPMTSRACECWQHFPGRAWEGPTDPEAVRIVADEAKRKRDEAKKAASDIVAAARAAWKEARVSEVPEAERAALRRTLDAAVDERVLLGDFVLHLDDHGPMTVASVLAQRDKFHGATLADPLEPEYGGGRNKAILYLDGARGRVNSQAHGGQTFTLRAVSKTLEIEDGNANEIARQAAAVLATLPDIFRTGSGLVQIAFDPVAGMTDQRRMDDRDMQLHAPAVIRFIRFDKRMKAMVGANLSADHAALIRRACLLPDSPVRVLEGITYAPTMTTEGRVVQEAGYDAPTRLYYEPRTMFQPVPEQPTPDQVQQALQVLLRPFRSYIFASDTDRAILVAALLTACVRKALPTAPAFAVSAVMAGSGKTKLASCLAIMTCGTLRSTDPWPRDQAEIKKTLLARLKTSPPAIVFDNLTTSLDSSNLAAILTGPTYCDRLLGASDAATVSTRSLFVFTGNNLQISGDLNRRVLPIKINAPGIDPHARAFNHDPVAETKETWPNMVWAGLVLLRAYIAAGRPHQLGQPFGSFEAWASMIRDCVMWLGNPDPVAAIAANYAEDDEQDMIDGVMGVWDRQFGAGVGVSGHDMVIPWGSTFGDEVRSFIGNERMTLKAFLHWLGSHKDRPIAGRRFGKERADNRHIYKLLKS